MAKIDAMLDWLWLLIVSFFIAASEAFFALTSLLHPYGAMITISTIAFLGVCMTKLLNKVIITRRHKELEKEFTHWHTLRQEAMHCEDAIKGRRMAQNIDQAKLNKVYYDYFFEGLLLGMARKVIPLFFLFAFVNEMYRPQQMVAIFGRNYVLAVGGEEPLLIGAVLWFFLSLLGGYLFCFAAVNFLRFLRKDNV